ncbi:hypothetical protein Q8A67_024105 [Cirrhinus molitorella]|uniref:G-protein coupled receptors family 1 profile domain-containing protein n=1 Tax=Cirrhinus molitorella TaxID=172907 RepID=A0AA88P2V1_9TELE|nr:hypothetical protein Q8A67_024105 [Cirrhinus molitorella]
METPYTTPEVTDYPDYLDSPEVSNVSTSVCNTIFINDFCKNVLPQLYYIIFIASVLGNGVVLLVLYKFEKLNTVTNIFLINLVASNVVVTLTFPFQAIHYSSQWNYGEALCKLVNGADNLGFYSSILFLTLMTFDRYLAVVHCVAATKQRRTCYAAVLSAVVWIISLLASFETFVYFNVEEYPMDGLVCEDSRSNTSLWKVFSLYKQFVLFFILPLIVFVYCYFRITITVLATRMVGKHRTCNSRLVYAGYVTSSFARLYFCINPVFYTFLGRKFQNHVRGVLVSQVPCLSERISVSSSSKMLA